MKVSDSEECLDLLNFIHQNGNLSQRELSHKSGLSLGKVNYCIKALVDIGYLKIKNFQNSNNKTNYIYYLTPKGIISKTLIAKKFLQQKKQEYDKIKTYLVK